MFLSGSPFSLLFFVRFVSAYFFFFFSFFGDDRIRVKKISASYAEKIKKTTQTRDPLKGINLKNKQILMDTQIKRCKTEWESREVEKYLYIRSLNRKKKPKTVQN